MTSPFANVQISTWDDYDSTTLLVLVNGVDQSARFTVISRSGYNRTYSGDVPIVNGSNTVYAEVVDDARQAATHRITFIATINDRQAPIASAAPHNGERLDMGVCILDCFDAVVGYSTLAYVSLDVPRTVSLLYRSGQAAPAATVSVDATDTSYTAATTMSIRLRAPNGAFVTFLNGQSEHFFTSARGTSRLTARFDATGLATGAYDYTAIVTSYWSGADPRSAEIALRVLVVNEKNSRYGSGWSLPGVQTIHPQADGAMVLTDGAGSILRFGPVTPGCTGTCAFTSPTGDFSTLVRLASTVNGARYERRYADSSRAAFADDGTMLSVADRFGNRTSYTYLSGTRAISTVTDPAGKVTTFAYDGAGKLATITDPMGRVTAVTVDASGNVASIRDTAGEYPFQLPSYDTKHLLGEWHDKLGKRTAFTYDGPTRRFLVASRPSIAIPGTPSFTPQTHIAAPELQTTVTGNGAAGTATDPHARVLAVDPVATVTNANYNKTTYHVNRFGQPTKVVDALNRVTNIVYDHLSRVSSVTGVDGQMVTYDWTESRLAWFSQRGVTVRYEYNGTFADQVTRIWGGAREQRYWYNSAGCLVRSMVGADTTTAKKSTFECDARGRTTKATDPRGHRTTTFYAGTGLQNTDSTWISVDTTEAGYRRRTAWSRDVYGRTVTATDPQNRVTRAAYDELNRLVLGVGTIADSTRITHSALGVIKVVDAKGQMYQFEKNALGWDTLAYDPTGASQRMAYDGMGNMVQQRNRRGQTTTFAYDALGRPTSMTLPDGRLTTYAYDPAGLWVAWSSPALVDTLVS